MNEFEDIDDRSREAALNSPRFMGTDTYVENNENLFDAYATLRVCGIHPSIAFRRVWGEDFWSHEPQARIYAVESTERYNFLFRDKLLKTPIQELWNDRLAIHKLLSLANDVFEKGSTRLRAIQELNVLIGITIVDENGKTRKGGKMSDFYNDIGTESLRGASGESNEPDESPAV